MEKLHWLGQDLRFALRGLNRDRKFAALAVFALALGIGATTVIFSIIYNGVLAPFPYQGANRLAVFLVLDPAQVGEEQRDGFSMPEFLAYREQNHVFEDMIGRDYQVAFFTRGRETRQIYVINVTANTFQFLGVQPRSEEH